MRFLPSSLVFLALLACVAAAKSDHDKSSPATRRMLQKSLFSSSGAVATFLEATGRKSPTSGPRTLLQKNKMKMMRRRLTAANINSNNNGNSNHTHNPPPSTKPLSPPTAPTPPKVRKHTPPSVRSPPPRSPRSPPRSPPPRRTPPPARPRQTLRNTILENLRRYQQEYTRSTTSSPAPAPSRRPTFNFGGFRFQNAANNL